MCFIKLLNKWRKGSMWVKVNGEWKTKEDGPGPAPVDDFGSVQYLDGSNVNTVKIPSLADFNKLGNDFSTSSVTINNVTLTKDNIYGVVIGSSVKAIPNFFLRGCLAIDQPIEIPDTVDSILIGFLYQCTNFNKQILLPKKMSSIGSRFLYGCTSFNQPLVLPEILGILPAYGQEQIGEEFLSQCKSFNQPITFPINLTTIGANFLYECTSFNQPITFPYSGPVSIARNFLYGCTSFNQSITTQITRSSLVTVGDSFLSGCASFNKPLDIFNSSYLVHIGNNFLYNCRALSGSASRIDIGDRDPNIFTDITRCFSTTYSTAAMYTTGIYIKGANRAAWLSKFSNRTSSPYRKLVDYGS